ncbi:hypothetical protein VAWG006_30620 [Aeromonas enteropelogenes]|nr:hypothetical protein VAWG006_30620 [Aeromonas enteropelogenes]BEE22972.1 hypothetical protein VAWG007_30670 [Aeromonas enteropelogenes]
MQMVPPVLLSGMTIKHPTQAVNSLALEQTDEFINKLPGRITELEDRFNQHSGNSSEPPPVSGLKLLRLFVVSYYPPVDCPCWGCKELSHGKL